VQNITIVMREPKNYTTFNEILRTILFTLLMNNFGFVPVTNFILDEIISFKFKTEVAKL
jgi:hypothetical protein